jgi:ubiquitin carboxyl-terminal hydrolase L3
VIDCADTYRFKEEALSEIKSVLNDVYDEPGERKLWVVLNKQDLLPPEKRGQIVQDIKTTLEQELHLSVKRGRVRIFDLPGFSAFEHAYPAALLDEVADVLSGHKPPKRPTDGKPLCVPVSAHEVDLKKRVEQSISENTSAADIFWKGLMEADLPVWDHYNHLRAGYFVLVEGIACGNSVMKCADMFISHLDVLRTKKPERFRNTTHRYFPLAS